MKNVRLLMSMSTLVLISGHVTACTNPTSFEEMKFEAVGVKLKFSPNDQYIATQLVKSASSVEEEAMQGVYVFDLQNEGAVQEIGGRQHSDFLLSKLHAWSPDSNAFIYERKTNSADYESDTFVANVETNTVQQLETRKYGYSTVYGSTFGVSWALDGQSIYGLKNVRSGEDKAFSAFAVFDPVSGK